MSKTYIVDIASVYGVDEKAADNLQVRPDSLNQEWLIDQVKKGAIYVCDVIEEDAGILEWVSVKCATQKIALS